MTSLPASDPGSAAAWGSKRINPRPQSCLCLTWSGYPSNDDNDDDEQEALKLSFSKNSIVVEKQQFEEHVQCWIKDTEDKLVKECHAFSHECSSVRTGSQSTSSSICSEKRRSLAKLKIATAAVQQESARVYKTRQKTRERAEEMKRKLMHKVEEARKKGRRSKTKG